MTGASSGIGRETAITISKLGGSVLLTGRNKERLSETMEQMENPGKHIIEEIDLGKVDAIGIWLKDVITRHSLQFDGMVYAAGIYRLRPLAVTEYSELQEVMNINFLAPVCMLKNLLQGAICRKGSSFVFISSVSAEIGEIGLLGYGASKAALNSAVRSAAQEMARKGHRVNAIAPASIDTDMLKKYMDSLDECQKSEFKTKFPLGIGKPEDVANMAAFLLSDNAGWITGSVINIDGGYSKS